MPRCQGKSGPAGSAGRARAGAAHGGSLLDQGHRPDGRLAVIALALADLLGPQLEFDQSFRAVDALDLFRDDHDFPAEEPGSRLDEQIADHPFYIAHEEVAEPAGNAVRGADPEADGAPATDGSFREARPGVP